MSENAAKGSRRRLGHSLSEAEVSALLERTHRAQDGVMAAVGDKRRVGGEIACPVCGNGTLNYFVHEDHWNAPHNTGPCSTAGCVNWTM